MNLEEFHSIRKPFYIDNETLLVKFPTSKHMNTSHAEWFTDLGLPWCHTIRGYLYNTDSESFLMLYWNNFEIPNITCIVINYLFEYFPNVQWIGLGCKVGEVGQRWEPQLKVFK